MDVAKGLPEKRSMIQRSLFRFASAHKARAGFPLDPKALETAPACTL